MIELQDIWNDRNLSKDLKVRLVKALKWSALIYGAEACTLFKSTETNSTFSFVLFHFNATIWSY